MSAQWTSEIVGKLHAHKATQAQLADFMGVTPEYVSMVLNGKREPKGAEQTFRVAVERMVSIPSPKE